MRRRQRLSRFGVAAVLVSTAACSAIAGLDENFELGRDASTPSVTPDGNASSTSSGTTTTSSSGQTDANVDDGSSGSDTGPNDSGSDQDAPADACSGRNLPRPTALENFMPEAGSDCPTNVNRPFCFNFNGDVDTPPFGWSGFNANGGSVEVQPTTHFDAQRRLIATVNAGSSADAGAEVWIRDWNSGVGAHPQPLLVDAGSKAVLGFSFLLETADRQADLMQLQSGGRTYGLTVYPDPCGGGPRIARSGLDAANIDFGAKVDLGKWYRGEIRFNHDSAGRWSGEVLVGGVSTGSQLDIFPAGTQKELPAAILGGLINVGPSGVVKVDIDDMLMTLGAYP